MAGKSESLFDGLARLRKSQCLQRLSYNNKNIFHIQAVNSKGREPYYYLDYKYFT